MNVRIMLSAVVAGALLLGNSALACDGCGGHHDSHHGDKHFKHERHHDGHDDWRHHGWHDGHHGWCAWGHGVGPSRFSPETGEWLGGHGKGQWRHDDHGHKRHGRHDYGMHGHNSGMEIYNLEETLYVATLHGMLDENLPALFMQLMEEVGAQGLIGPDTHVGSVVPNAISEDDMSKIQVWPGINVMADTVVAAPLQKHSIEPQSFALFVHVGPYDKLPDTWVAAFEFIHANGIELDPQGWALERYVSDPMETPEEELITHIYLPLLHDEVSGHGRGKGKGHGSYKH